MSKRAFIAATVILALLTLTGMGVQAVKTQPINNSGDGAVLNFDVISPSNNTVYSSNLLTLNFTQVVLFNPPSSANITVVYSIDGKENATIPIIPLDYMHIITGLSDLPHLSKGSHNMTIYGKYYYLNGASQVVTASKVAKLYFAINDGIAPAILNPLIENKIYTQNSLPLNLTIDQPTSWIGYSLDNQANVSITENTTLTGLTDGSHSIIVYANDTAGNMGNSQTITFTVDRTEPFPCVTIIIAISSIAIVICIGVSLLLFRRHRKTAKLSK